MIIFHTLYFRGINLNNYIEFTNKNTYDIIFKLHEIYADFLLLHHYN